jgi:glycosyltransferase involved in cell wall biosynthesis
LGSRVLIAPYSDVNARARPANLDKLHLVAIDASLATGVADRIAARIPRFQLLPSHRRAILSDAETILALRSADVVEYHWEDIARGLLPGARRLAPAARHVVYLHDVVSQALARTASRRTGARAMRADLSTWLARLDEHRITSLADCVIVLSDKDRALLKDQAKVVVQRPVVRVTSPSVQRPPDASHEFIFVAAFDRPSNREAAEWLRYEVWPGVHARVPKAKLTLAGASSDKLPADLVEPALGIRATGYVSDLGALYAQAAVALVPILHGAGVKFKTLEAMITATPTVSTSVGAEGIDRAAEFIEIADTPQDFADAAVRLVSEQRGGYAERAARGAAWARSAHGERQSQLTLVRAITGRKEAEAQLPQVP